MNIYLIIGILIGLVALRTLVVFSFQKSIHSNWAKKTIIYDIPLTEKQQKRENYQPFYGAILDSTFALPLIMMNIITFTSLNIIEPLVLIGAHVLIVEPLYYFYHRILHMKKLYLHHHQYHHLSTTVTPNTSFTFTALERFSYTLLFAIPIITAALLNVLTIYGFILYFIVFDVLNTIGHLNYEIFHKNFYKSPLKYIIYTPSFHSQHHSKFRKNYALFMPLWDHLFHTVEETTDDVFKSAVTHHPLHRVTEIPKHYEIK